MQASGAQRCPETAQNVAAIASPMRRSKRETEVFMGKVILDMSMSVDGFIAGPNDEDGGLHNYFFSPSGNCFSYRITSSC